MGSRWTKVSLAIALACVARTASADGLDTSAAERRGGPHRLLLTTGLATFGFGWSASLYVGLSSTRDSDRALVVPFAGPWIALGTRSACFGASCGDEATYKTLLVTDGVLQAGAAAQVALAFLLRERPGDHTRTVEPSLAWTVGPMHVTGGAGAMARATF